MSDLQFNLDNRNPADNRSPAGKPGGVGATIFLLLFATPFAGFGLVALVQGVRKLLAGPSHDGAMLCLFGLIFSGVGLGLMFAALWSRRKVKQTAELQARFADKPWLLRADWASGKIKSSAMAKPLLYLVMALAFCGIGGVATCLSLPQELHRNNYAALLLLIFPTAGLGFLMAFVRAWWSRLAYGECVFELAEVPAPLGGALSGMIQAGARLKPEHGLHLRLACVRRFVTGSGQNRRTQETVLWQDEKVYKPEAGLPEAAPGRSGIPVYFKLPAGQPQCFTHGEVSVSWRLEAKAKMAGPDFAAAFDVPVFQVAGAAAEPAADTVPELDPTAALQMPIEELRRDEHSKIQLTDGPGGREFYFPAARNPGAALFTTVIAAALDGGVGLILRFHGPIIFAIFLSLFGVILSCFAFSLWFKSSRVTINSTGVTAVNHWLIFSRTRQFDAGDVARIETKPGMTSGTKTYADLKLVTKGKGDDFQARQAAYLQTAQRPPLKFGIGDPSGVTIASGISSQPEANWLVQEMTRAIGRRE